MRRASWGGWGSGECPHDYLYAPRTGDRIKDHFPARGQKDRDHSILDKIRASEGGYRWGYGFALYSGFYALGYQPAGRRKRARRLRFFTRDWLDRVDPKLGESFLFTGPFTRVCHCHCMPLDDEDELLCPVKRKVVTSWDVVDAKGRLLVSVYTHRGDVIWSEDYLVYPDEVTFIVVAS